MAATDVTLKKRAIFLGHLAKTGNVSESSKMAGFCRITAYRHRDSDPEFAEAWKNAEAIAVDALIAEARRRAVEGTDKPIYHKGERIDTVKEYSDTLLIVLLKAHDPRFKDKIQTEVSADSETISSLYGLISGKTRGLPGDEGEGGTE